MFIGFYLTQNGRKLQAKVEAGAALKFTRFAVGDGKLSSGQSPEKMTALVSPVGYFPVSALETNVDMARISFQFTNVGISYAWNWAELGLYATDPDDGEVLYAYANAGDAPDNIPSAADSVIEYLYSLNIVVSNAASVDVDIDNSILYVTKKELEEVKTTVSDLNKKLNGFSSADGFVSYEEAQNLTEDQKNKARSNIGADTVDNVKYVAQTLSEAQKVQARANIGADSVGNVKYSGSQSLTDAQKLQARANIGAGTSNFDGTYGSLLNKPSVVMYSSQSLNDDQKTQARKNIGAAAVKSTVISIGAGSWSGPAPYIADVYCEIATASNTLIIGPAPSNTPARREMIRNANISCTAQSEKMISFIADGECPTDVIYISVTALG